MVVMAVLARAEEVGTRGRTSLERPFMEGSSVKIICDSTFVSPTISRT